MPVETRRKISAAMTGMKRKPIVAWRGKRATLANLPSHVDLSWLLQRCDVHDETGCWIWRLGTTKRDGGYGSFAQVIAPRTRAHYMAHRVALQLATGKEGEGLQACHSPRCVSSRCCNPDHLQWGTSLDNNRDSTWKNGRRPLPHFNERSGWSLRLPRHFSRETVIRLIDEAFLAEEGHLPWENYRWKEAS